MKAHLETVKIILTTDELQRLQKEIIELVKKASIDQTIYPYHFMHEYGYKQLSSLLDITFNTEL